MTDEKLRSELKVHHQGHLLHFYDELNTEEQAELLAQLHDLDLSYTDHFAERAKGESRGNFAPLAAMTIPEINERREEFLEAGLSMLRKGRAAAVLLAGGMGTRLGITGPKGCYDIGITRPVYIFQRIIENLAEAAGEAGRPIHLFIMTGGTNDEATRAFFREHDAFGYPKDYIHFFVQEMAPAVDEEGRILLETKTRPALSPNGNGGWFRSMEKAGLTELCKREGIEWLNVFAVDNVLQKICDPVFLGAVIREEMPCGAKVVAKCSPDERVGVMCLEDGHPSVVEYYEMTDEMRNAADAEGRRLYNYGVILNYFFRMEELEKAAAEQMPLHFAHKKIRCIDEHGNEVIPAEPNGWKFEYFILDLIRSFSGCLPFEVEREKEFAPVKNSEGADSPDTARALLAAAGYQL